MNRALVLIGVGLSALIGFLLVRRTPALGPGHAVDVIFRSHPGTGDGFCKVTVQAGRPRGRAFHWKPVGPCRPEPGGYFQIRVKNRPSPLIPERPRGNPSIFAEVQHWAVPGDVYRYSFWQVLADGRERELVDPELEIGQI
jgi:hypothetical protein